MENYLCWNKEISKSPNHTCPVLCINCWHKTMQISLKFMWWSWNHPVTLWLDLGVWEVASVLKHWSSSWKSRSRQQHCRESCRRRHHADRHLIILLPNFQLTILPLDNCWGGGDCKSGTQATYFLISKHIKGEGAAPFPAAPCFPGLFL